MTERCFDLKEINLTKHNKSPVNERWRERKIVWRDKCQILCESCGTERKSIKINVKIYTKGTDFMV
jgi:hypothetical protein